MSFNSRSELFKHISREGHVSGSDGEEENFEHTSRVASGRGRKQASRGFWNHNKLFIHRNQNIEEVNNIHGWMTSHDWNNKRQR